MISTNLLDPDLGAVPFTVIRTTYRRSAGSLVPSVQTYSAAGCIHPGPAESLRLTPGEEQKEDCITIYTSFRLSAGENPAAGYFTASDRVRYGDALWRVVRVREWPAFSLVQALAVKTGDTDDS